MTVKPTRRRGDALRDAILQAAWDELLAKGYGGFTLEGVSNRAGTSRPVLARRWQSRPDLALAALGFYLAEHPVQPRDFGNLRDDLLFVLQKTAERSVRVNQILFSMRDYFRETGSNLADLRGKLGVASGEKPTGQNPLADIMNRAVERGEIDPGKLTKRIASLPADLVRHEALMTNRPVRKETIAEILDTIFLPLVTRS